MNLLKEKLNPYSEYSKKLRSDLLTIAKEADDFDIGICSECGENLENAYVNKLRFCPVCGQEIKWKI